jgi:hypothetical protein
MKHKQKDNIEVSISGLESFLKFQAFMMIVVNFRVHEDS